MNDVTLLSAVMNGRSKESIAAESGLTVEEIDRRLARARRRRAAGELTVPVLRVKDQHRHRVTVYVR
jgi:hypothetical protein